MPDLRSGNQAVTIRVSGGGADSLDGEGGGVRVQRVPKSERQGRVHTSTVTVAVLDPSETDAGPYGLREARDFELEWYSGTVKAGGQKHNKTATCLRLRHKPTGFVQTAQTRSRGNSSKLAFSAINKALDEAAETADHGRRNGLRKGQIGSGMRAGEKRRTFRFQDDRAVDHLTGKSARAADVMQGRLDLLWDRTSAGSGGLADR